MDKKAFVFSMFTEDPDRNMATLSSEVRRKFGKGLNMMHVRRLRDAFAEGSFDRVWDELLGDEEEYERSRVELERAGKRRGERRGKLKIKGRRRIDRDKIRLSEFNNHLVVYRAHDGMMRSHNFKSRKMAESLVKDLLREGVPADAIGYFRRSEVVTKLAA